MWVLALTVGVGIYDLANYLKSLCCIKCGGHTGSKGVGIALWTTKPSSTHPCYLPADNEA